MNGYRTFLMAALFFFITTANAEPFTKEETIEIGKLCPEGSKIMELNDPLRRKGFNEAIETCSYISCSSSYDESCRPRVDFKVDEGNAAFGGEDRGTNLIKVSTFDELKPELSAKLSKGLKPINERRKLRMVTAEKREGEQQQKEASPACIAAKTVAEYCYQLMGARNQKLKQSIVFYDKKAKEANSRYQQAKGKSLSPEICEFVPMQAAGVTVSGKAKKRFLDQAQSACGHSNLGFEFY